ncbi:MAG: hypothetical protein QOD09_2152 [Bradyrhizobium sp.]|jgi:hypothetical protein|nr:hypothetical protein [Bradyrhizobium sp.]
MREPFQRYTDTDGFSHGGGRNPQPPQKNRIVP